MADPRPSDHPPADAPASNEEHAVSQPHPRPQAGSPEPPDDEVRDEVRADSDALLRAIDELRRLESAKRDVPMSTQAFHDHAARIEDLARGVFGLASKETVDGDRLEKTQPNSINDEAAEDDGAVDGEASR
jgi:hypothetical protein